MYQVKAVWRPESLEQNRTNTGGTWSLVPLALRASPECATVTEPTVSRRATALTDVPPLDLWPLAFLHGRLIAQVVRLAITATAMDRGPAGEDIRTETQELHTSRAPDERAAVR